MAGRQHTRRPSAGSRRLDCRVLAPAGRGIKKPCRCPIKPMLKDYLQKFMLEGFPVKGSLVRLDSSWQEVRSRATPPDFAHKMLGEALCASVLLTSSIKFRG